MEQIPLEHFQPTNPWLFVGICVAWLGIAFFFLGARKVYFEPYATDKTED
jgi:hypothetical protein